MSIIKRAGDLVYTFRFLRLLTTAFEDTEAFKLGIIDKDGKRDKTFTLKEILKICRAYKIKLIDVHGDEYITDLIMGNSHP